MGMLHVMMVVVGCAIWIIMSTDRIEFGFLRHTPGYPSDIVYLDADLHSPLG